MAAADPRVFLPRQFENQLNARAHQRETGPELIQQVGTTIHGFVAGVGTGGTLMGIARALREAGHPTRIARVFPEKGSACFQGQPEICGGIPGIVDGLSTILDAKEVGLDEDIKIDERDAINAARELCKRGLPVGPSSGLNFAAARVMGAPPLATLWRHVLPNIAGALVTQAAIVMPRAITTESVLSFFGLGVAPETPSWGRMISGASRFAEAAPHAVLAPVLALCLVTLGFALAGDRLRLALDPLRERGR